MLPARVSVRFVSHASLRFMKTRLTPRVFCAVHIHYQGGSGSGLPPQKAGPVLEASYSGNALVPVPRAAHGRGLTCTGRSPSHLISQCLWKEPLIPLSLSQFPFGHNSQACIAMGCCRHGSDMRPL